MSHVLFLYLTPPPHVTVHSDHWAQGRHNPETVFKPYVCVKYFEYFFIANKNRKEMKTLVCLVFTTMRMIYLYVFADVINT